MELFDEDDEEFFRKSRLISQGERFVDDVRHSLPNSGPTSRQFMFTPDSSEPNGDVSEVMGTWPLSAPSSLDRSMLTIDARRMQNCSLQLSNPQMTSSHASWSNLGPSLAASHGPDPDLQPGTGLPQPQTRLAGQISQLPPSWTSAPMHAPSSTYMAALAPSSAYMPVPVPSSAYMPVPVPAPAQVPIPAPPASMHAPSSMYVPPISQLTALAGSGRCTLGYPHEPSFGSQYGQQQMVASVGVPPLGAPPAVTGADLAAAPDPVMTGIIVCQEDYHQQHQRQQQQLLLHYQHQDLQVQLPQQYCAQPQQQQPQQLQMQPQLQQQQQQLWPQQQLEQQKREMQQQRQLQQQWQQQQQRTQQHELQLQRERDNTLLMEAKPQLLQAPVYVHPQGDLSSRYPQLQPLESQPTQVQQLLPPPKLQLQPDPQPLLQLKPRPLPKHFPPASRCDDVQGEDALMAEIMAAPWPSSKTAQDATAAAHAAAVALTNTKLMAATAAEPPIHHHDGAKPQSELSGVPAQVSAYASGTNAPPAPDSGPNTPSQSSPPPPESWQGSRRGQAPGEGPSIGANGAAAAAEPTPVQAPRSSWTSVPELGAVPLKMKTELGGAELKTRVRSLDQAILVLGGDNPRAMALKLQTTLLQEHQPQPVVSLSDLRLAQPGNAALGVVTAAVSEAVVAAAGPAAAVDAGPGCRLLSHALAAQNLNLAVAYNAREDAMEQDLKPPLPDSSMPDDHVQHAIDSNGGGCVTVSAAGGSTTTSTAAAAAAAHAAAATANTADSGRAGSKAANGRVTLEVLRSMFHLPVADVARTLGASSTDLKRRCRALGIGRWPQRKLTSLDKLGRAIEKDPCITEGQRQEQLALIARNRAEILQDPDAALDSWIGPTRQLHYKRNFVDRRGGFRTNAKKKNG